MLEWCYLATICNSMIIEMCDDIIRVSHGFDGCQILEYIADISTGHQRNRNNDIISFFSLLKFQLCGRDIGLIYKSITRDYLPPTGAGACQDNRTVLSSANSTFTHSTADS